ncbi:nuclear factor of activated T-cells, cytoplasmic 2 [Syngnathus typhle]|uniref:nuclear factor of activated T-cells, cytoplasmic 2 n=1 Tax=Syngnathus typhle TaxID=161592 RepID=UPI002A6A1C77|nr:nuclear factor of activated T-cells, cytoplasmic 2 [Syngnathus typhle]
MASDICQEELDFSDLFLYNAPGEDFSSAGYIPDGANQAAVLEARPAEDSSSEVAFGSRYPRTRRELIPAPGPRIEITPSAGDCFTLRALEQSPGFKALGAYRECASPASSNSSAGLTADGCSPSVSPCISPSNRGACATEHSTIDICSFLQDIQTSSAQSSPANSFTEELFLLPEHRVPPSLVVHRRCRSASPQGKRAHEQVLPCPGPTPVKQRSRSPSPIPSPYTLHGSYPLHHSQVPDEHQSQGQASGLCSNDKVSGRIFSRDAALGASRQRPACVYREGHHELERVGRLEDEAGLGGFRVLPTSWAPPPHPIHFGAFGGLSLAPLPSLDWPLPSRTSQYELVIKSQPRSHHRAHYETEGSRGPVKTPNGGHPEVQLLGYRGTAPLGLQVFIGTADERLMKAHAFYQAHRITGKTVTTPCTERMLNGTKVLEIPLQPSNHMTVVVDCVGILKRKNIDIELRDGETDVGRKNTRVRLVFRVHVPQPGGQWVSLQAASHPIECSQHSAQEIPLVKMQNLDRCSVLGGQQMILTGQNFSYDARVMFSEKAQDGQQIWEVEANVERENKQPNMLMVLVPPYRDGTICHPAKVNFYVINGKKKRSEPRHLIYTPVIDIKTEPVDGWQERDYPDPRSDTQIKSPFRRLEKERSLQPFSALASDAWNSQAVLYQSRTTGLINEPAIFHPTNQLYYPSNAISIRKVPGSNVLTATDKRSQVPRAYSSTRLQGFVQAKMASSRLVQSDICGKSSPRTDSSGADRESQTHHERVTVKQEDLSCVYLEDVNDIIRRDLTAHRSDAAGGHPDSTKNMT